MEKALVAPAAALEMAAPAPAKKSTGPKTSTSCSALSNKNSKETEARVAEGLQAPVQTETLP